MAHRREFSYKNYHIKAPKVEFRIDNLADFQVNDIPILTAADALTLGAPVSGVHPDGAIITGSELQLNLADGTNPGMVASIGNPYSGTDTHGVKLTAGVLQLQLADGTHPGVLAGTAVGVPYAGTDANGIKVTAGEFQLQLANATSPGVVSSGNQTFGGIKTFADVDLVSPGGKITYGTANLLQIGTNINPSLTLGLNSLPSGNGDSNVIIGNLSGALITSDFNTSCGTRALQNVEEGEENVCMGYQAGGNLLNGGDNTLIGFQAGLNCTDATSSTALGSGAGKNWTTGDECNLALNSKGQAGDSNVIRIQDIQHNINQPAHSCYIGGIQTVTLPSGNNPKLMLIDPTNDQLGVIPRPSVTQTINCANNSLTNDTPYTVLPTVGTYGIYQVAVAAQGVVVPPGDYLVIFSAQMGNCNQMFCLFNSVFDSDGTTVNWTRSEANGNGLVTGQTDSRNFSFLASVAVTSRFQFTLEALQTAGGAITQAASAITIKQFL